MIARLRGVGDAEAQIGRRIGRAADRVEPVAAEVGIVDPADVDDAAGDLQVGPHVGQVLPPGRDQIAGERRPVDRRALRVAAAAGEVAHRVLERRLVVVVVARHEDARAIEQRLQRAQHGRPGVGRREHVAGQHDQIGQQPAEVADPLLLGASAGRACAGRTGAAPAAAANPAASTGTSRRRSVNALRS